jgi:hypothetical protein
MENSNIKIVNFNGNLKGVVTTKTYKYCMRCGKSLPEGSIEAFCDFECKSSYYTENAREIDSVWREIRGID